MQQINTIIGGQDALIVLPDDYSAARTYYLIEWFHGMGGDEQSLVAATNTAILNAMLPMGYIFCATNAHGDNWGNDASLADYAALVAYMRANYHISHVAFWGGSMGGAAALIVLAQGTIASVRGAFLVYPVCSLGAIYNDLSWADASIEIAYNIPGGGSYETQTAGHDALLRPASVYAGKRFRFTASPGDTYVPKATNSDAFAAHVSAVATEMTVLPINGEHGAEDGMVTSDVVAFFERCCRFAEPPVISNPLAVYAPVITKIPLPEIAPPLISNAFQVFAPSSVETRGRPLAEDIRIMRVRRSE